MKLFNTIVLIGLIVLAFTGCTSTNGYPSLGPAFAPVGTGQSSAYWYGYTQGKSYVSPVATSPMKGN